MKSILSTAALAMRLLSLSSVISADRVFWTNPTNNSNVYAGCDLELGFRVQYSDLAILGYVQLQVLDSENKVMVEDIDNSTREDWDSVRAKNVTWSVPQDWPAGDYILRAFGNAHYSCKENGQRTFCPLLLEDRETIHVEHLMAGQGCPAVATPSSASTSTPSPSSSSSSRSSPSPATNSKDSITTPSKESMPVSVGVSDPSSQKPSIHIDVDSSILDLMRKNGINLDQIANSTDGKTVDGSDSKQPKELDQKGSNIINTGKQPLPSSGARNAKIGSGNMWTTLGKSAGLACLAVAISFF
ncbi:hypothetical protein BGX26_003967 [Mortierella sp. AD094]|nr:hypothetical protein BGX26_003967 [Mortierella sp. AD094]